MVVAVSEASASLVRQLLNSIPASVSPRRNKNLLFLALHNSSPVLRYPMAHHLFWKQNSSGELIKHLSLHTTVAELKGRKALRQCFGKLGPRTKTAHVSDMYPKLWPAVSIEVSRNPPGLNGPGDSYSVSGADLHLFAPRCP